MDEAETSIFDYDAGNVEFSWSGDAKFVAVSCVNPEKRSRNFFLWSDEGEFLSRMEIIAGAESPIAYR